MYRTTLFRILRAPDADAPPAATLVNNSDAEPADAQELVRLRRENGELSGRVKKHETRIAELEDENGQLKRVTKGKPADPQPQPAAKSKLNEWLWD